MLPAKLLLQTPAVWPVGVLVCLLTVSSILYHTMHLPLVRAFDVLMVGASFVATLGSSACGLLTLSQ